MRLIIEPGITTRNYSGDLWRYRELVWFLTWRDISVRYKQTFIGIAWAVLRPALTMLVFVVFRRMLGVAGGPVPDPILIFAGLLPWQFFSSGLSDCASSLVSNANLISKIYFPRLIVPIAAVLASLVDFLITVVLLAVIMFCYGFAPGWQLVAFPALVLLLFVLSLGAGLLLAALNVEYRDFRYVVPFIVQFGLFISPVAFSTDAVPENWRMLYALNPLVGIIDGFRWSLLGGQVPSMLETISISTAVTASMIVLGLWYFRRMESSFADVI
jgi:lipopolysaccharide transport system permease protein